MPATDMQHTDIDFIPYAPQWLDELIPMWRASFEHGVGVTDPHPLAEQRDYFLAQVLPGHAVQLAVHGGQLVGFAAASREALAQLYVRVGWHRQGIGRRLLDWAKARSGGSLWLYTFARNKAAQAFYERQGFTVVARGFEPTWQLEDIRYQWTATASAPVDDSLPPLPPTPTGRYRHYKGGEYEVMGVARHSETHEPLVVYRPLYNDSGWWVRPHAMFFGQVEVGGQRVPRFAPLESA